MTAWILVAVLVLLAGVVRWIPHYFAPGGLGVDQWYWKAYRDACRQSRCFPPDLPQYLLDEKQWYPPVFPLVISTMPDALFERYSHLIAICIDLVRLLLLLSAASLISDSSLLVISVAGLCYTLAPILVSYNIQLNPRGLGALMLDGLVLLLVWHYTGSGPAWIWLPALLLAALILLTHKMTTQLFWFVSVAAGCILADWRLLVLPAASIVAATLLSGGFYLKVLRAHWDIVAFWNRNWRWLQANPVKESPIYGEKGFVSPTKHHQPSFNGLVRHLRYHAGYLPAAWLLFPALASAQPATTTERWMIVYICMILAFALATSLVPLFKCLGSGYYYLYNAAFPVTLLWGMLVEHAGLLNKVSLALAVLISVVSLALFIRRLTTSSTQRQDDDFESVLDFLKKSPDGTVMCLPPQWYDVIAYKTGKAVLWGAHGYGFKLIEPTFPRLLVPLAHLASTYNIRYLVTMENYLNDSFKNDLLYKDILKFGPYRVYCLIPYDGNERILVSDKVHI